MADSPQDPFVAGVANIRETTKWLVGAMVTAVLGVLAGSALTSLGALDWGWRLFAALAGAGVAYVLLGVLLWNTLDVVTSETVSFLGLIGACGSEAKVRGRIEARMAPVLPEGCKTFADLNAATQRRLDDQSAGSDERFAAFTAQVVGLEPQLGFEYKRDRFVRLRRLIFILMPFVVIGVSVFAWAANPKPATILTSTPRYTTLILDLASAAVLAQAEGPGCHTVFKAGGGVRAVAAEEDEGRTQLIVLPSEPNCGPVRLVRQNGGVFAPK